MANVSHASLTGSQLHEPKGAAAAALGTVYVADGAGSGNWANVGTSSFTGMIADFTWPVVQNGWLELDGSVVSSTTYAALYNVMTIQTNGTRINGNAIITSISSTANMRSGYYVFGTGIASGTTILTVDSANQITLSATASSSGTATIIVSPWLTNTGTIKLPDVSTAGRYRRSRTASTAIGQVQADQNKAHTHSVSATTGIESTTHTHGVSGTTASDSPNHTHSYNPSNAVQASVTPGGGLALNIADTTAQTGTPSTPHTHTFSATSGTQTANHTHSFSTTSASDGGTETRPLSLIVMTCVKT
jgi:hypothetical protein